ncbi:MAG: RNA polymerase sigma factor, partial [Methylovirgula sp.]
DGAIANLRRTARRKTWKEENRSQPLSYDDETSELSSEVEDALARLNPQSPEKIDDPAYRKRFAAAIDSLPEDQRRVIVLLLRDIQIESKDPEAVTIVKVLACSEKTVRNRRDRAFKALRAALDEDLDHDDFGLNQSKIINVIDAKRIERDASGKPLTLFLIPL